jgi:hypothetical protein
MKLVTHLQLVQGSRIREFVHILPYKYSWSSDQLRKHRDNFTLAYII